MLLLLLSNGYWWRANRRPAELADRPVAPSLDHARRALQQACAEGDSGAARAALLGWGAALLAPRPVGNLSQLCTLLGDDLSKAVDELNRSRYAPAGGDWQADELWQLCQRLERDYQRSDRASASELQPLNP